MTRAYEIFDGLYLVIEHVAVVLFQIAFFTAAAVAYASAECLLRGELAVLRAEDVLNGFEVYGAVIEEIESRAD